MVDSPGLENRYSLKQRTIEGSNPSLSFFWLLNRFVSLLVLTGLVSLQKGARLAHRAEPKKIDSNFLR